MKFTVVERYDKASEFMQTYFKIWLKVGCKGDVSVALTPVQNFSLRGLSSTREIWSEITRYPKPSEPPTDSFCKGTEIKVKQ